jgi:hypothetical protein
MTEYLSISIPQILEDVPEYDDVADRIQVVQQNVDNIPDPTSAFGNDQYGRKAIPNILAAKQASDQLLSGVHGMVTGASQNLVITGQTFGNANDVNGDLVKPFIDNP